MSMRLPLSVKAEMAQEREWLRVGKAKAFATSGRPRNDDDADNRASDIRLGIPVALEKHDPGRGVKLTTHIASRVAFALVDGNRDRSHLNRGDVTRLGKGEDLPASAW